MSDGTKIGTGYIQVMPEMKDFTSAVKSQTGNVLEQEGEQAGGKFSSGLKKGLQLAGAAITAAMAGTVKLATDVISAYGNYEQLVGGVQKLFGDMDYQAVVDNASEAFKTAGLSANEYMETVTSFSASLISSLEGDTKAAVSYADQAITDMSDNANTFGTDMESIQYAYQGFAKQNFTMLDNLKLGYGGTKTEMERLITDAEKLDSSFQATRDSNGKLTLSFADIVDAIHIVQEDMGIAGTTAKEAAGTVEGSINTMKAAWQNLLTGMGDSNADIGKLTKDFTDSFENVVKNIKPVLQNFSSALPEIIGSFMDVAADVLPDLIVDLLPAAVSGSVKLAAGLVTHFPEIIKGVVEGLVDGIAEAITGEKTGWFDSLLGDYEEVIEEMTRQNDSLARSIQGTKDAYDSQVGSVQANAAVAGQLWGELQYLINSEDQSAQTKARIRDLVEELNGLIPGLGLAYDELTGKINLTDQEMQHHIELMLLEAQQEAANEMYIQSIKDRIQARQDLDTANREYKEVLDQLNISEESYNQAMADGNLTKGELIDLLVGGGTSLVEALFKVDDVAEQVAQAHDNMDQAAENWVDAVNNETLASALLTETYKRLHDTGEDMAGSLSTAFQETFGYEIPEDLNTAVMAAQEAGIGIPQELIDNILNGKTSVEDAIEQIVGLMDQTDQAAAYGEETGSAYDGATATTVIDDRPQVEAAAKLATDALDTSDQAGDIGDVVGASFDSSLAGQQGNIQATASSIADSVTSEFAPLPGEMSTAGSDSGSNLNSGFDSWNDTIYATVDDVYEIFNSTLSVELGANMNDWGYKAGQHFDFGLTSYKGTIDTTVSGIVTSIQTTMSGLPAEMYSVGSMAGQGLYNGLAAWQGALSSAAWSIANSINAAARSALQIKSPSKVMMEVGEYAVEGFTEGIRSGTGDVIEVADNMSWAFAGTASDYANEYDSGEAAYNDNTGEYLDQIITLLNELKNWKMVVDSGEVIGVFAPLLNKKFEAMDKMAKRG